MIPSWAIFTIGFAAQAFFTARTFFQWLKSERAKRVVSPSSYWVLSVLGAYTMFVYGVLRNDFSIILGQLISYYIYLWNLNAKGIWEKLGLVLQTVLLATPVVAALLLAQNGSEFVHNFFRNDGIPLWLVVFGSLGQVIFTLRFVYQWAYSRRTHVSQLPLGFWIISLIGSGTIVAYGIIRRDPVLILGQAFGFMTYVRNLMLCLKRPADEQA
ncbi:MAG: lipid-A-disaccharide synthase N-terminal domain-containing protein [Bacteroidales bacterium]|nr:lipid-A-disaccharide synthase N-terminal domain-containing protein [Bacteroidales bacterium]